MGGWVGRDEKEDKNKRKRMLKCGVGIGKKKRKENKIKIKKGCNCWDIRNAFLISFSVEILGMFRY